jgi:hypothetical protein
MCGPYIMSMATGADDTQYIKFRPWTNKLNFQLATNGFVDII